MVSAGFVLELKKMWYNISMTKLQTIEAEFQTLPVEEQREFISRHVYLVDPAQEDFEFTDAERAEIKDLLENDTGSYTMEEVMAPLLKKYAPNHTA